MLSLSGFERYSLWVPLMRTETQKKTVNLVLQILMDRKQDCALFASCKHEIIFPRFMGSRLPE